MGKSMIFLFDGTAADASDSSDNTIDTYSNVYRINQLISEEKTSSSDNKKSYSGQIVFYLPGVGTKFTVWRPKKSIFSRSDRVRQQIFGEGVEQLILRAYINLCSNFKPDDQLYIIGFSRGAAAGRIFSRLISDFGILVSERLSLLDRLWNEFIRISMIEADEPYFTEIENLKKDVAQAESKDSVFHPSKCNKIEFMGLFDTVIGKLDSSLRSTVDFRDSYPAQGVKKLVHLLSMHDVRKEYEFKRFDRRATMPDVFREIWIPGVHSDVGGGYQDDFIGNVSLLTLADLMEKVGGISIDMQAYKRVLQKIRQKIASQDFAINREPFVTIRESRYNSIYRDDELHPLHDYLVGRNVRWKGVHQVQYEDRHKNNENRDDNLVSTFRRWVNID